MNARYTAIFVAFSLLSAGSFGMCYQVYDEENNLVYSSPTAPVALESDDKTSLSERVMDLFPGGHLIATPTERCPSIVLQEARHVVEIDRSQLPTQAELAKLNRELVSLYKRKQYSRAVAVAEKGLSVAESAFGPQHLFVADSLLYLSQVHKAQSRYAQAEAALNRALLIYEKAFGPYDSTINPIATSLIEIHVAQKHHAKAVPLTKRLLANTVRRLGPNHLEVVVLLKSLAKLYNEQGQNEKAQPIYKRMLAIQEKVLGQYHPSVAETLYVIGFGHLSKGRHEEAESTINRALAIQESAYGPPDARSLYFIAKQYATHGQHSKAEPILRRQLAIEERTLGHASHDVMKTLSNLGEVCNKQRQYERAGVYLRQSLAIGEKILGPDHPDVVFVLNNIAVNYYEQGLYAKAEPLFKRQLMTQEKALGPNHVDIAKILIYLAVVHDGQGQYELAGLAHKRALAIREVNLGLDHTDVANSLSNLGAHYTAQGKDAEAEPLHKRALAIREKALGPDHPDVAISLHHLAGLGVTLLNPNAEVLFQRALAIQEKSLGPDHPDLAHNLHALASRYSSFRNFAQAEPLYLRALKIVEQAKGPEHIQVAPMLIDIASSFEDQGRSEQAEILYMRALAIQERSLGPNHRDVADSLGSLATLKQTQGHHAQALSFSRRASAIYRTRVIAGGTGETAVAEASRNRFGFHTHLSLLSWAYGKEPTDGILDETFQIAQIKGASGTASAIAKMAARFAKGDDALASLVKRKQDATDRRAKQEARLVAASSKLPGERRADDEKSLRDAIISAGQELEGIDAELARRFPEYEKLTRPTPLSIEQLRALLKPGEAMLVYELGSSWGSAAYKSSYLWVVRPDGADFVALALDVKDLTAKVATIRSEMSVDDNGVAKRVSVGILNELYRQLFDPVVSKLAGVKHVMIVPTGPLQSLPFGMLLATPASEIRHDSDYRHLDWLVNRYAFTVLPAVNAIRAFRQFAGEGAIQEPFAGFGDPVIGQANSTRRGKRAGVDVATMYGGIKSRGSAKNDSRASFPLLELADVEAIRRQERLPETADELLAMAEVLKAGPGAIWLREDATETRVRGMDLSKYKTIAFATHGVMASQMPGVGEPGLILTPPRQGTTDDDGYLSAGEIAGLKLNADWVLLSACNTAAADGTPGAEGLSGLAKAFFYAGARSLLVSHWPVMSEATVPLTTRMLREYEANPSQGKAEAHRKAMLALIATPDQPQYAHPLFWAPFVVVGEGGPGGR